MDYEKYLWHFRHGADWEKDGAMQTEILHAHHMCSRARIEMHPKVIEHERMHHRRAVGDKIMDAIYRGWYPYDVEWWEGQYDDPWVLKDYSSISTLETDLLGTDTYHFWTRVKIAAQWGTPQMIRNPEPELLTIDTYTPRLPE